MSSIQLKNVLEDLQAVERKHAQLASRVEGVVRRFKLDEVGKQDAVDSRMALEDAVARNTVVVGQLISTLLPPVNLQDMHLRNRAQRSREVRRNLRHKFFLRDTCTRKTVKECPCGESHKAIQFFRQPNMAEKIDGTKDPILVQTVCPRVWWIWSSEMAFAEGKLSQFTKEHPLEQYMKSMTRK